MVSFEQKTGLPARRKHADFVFLDMFLKSEILPFSD
jgi:hypothetical protein